MPGLLQKIICRKDGLSLVQMKVNKIGENQYER